MHNSVLLRNAARYELRRQDQPFSDPAPDDENNIGVEAVTDDDDDEGRIASTNKYPP